MSWPVDSISSFLNARSLSFSSITLPTSISRPQHLGKRRKLLYRLLIIPDMKRSKQSDDKDRTSHRYNKHAVMPTPCRSQVFFCKGIVLLREGFEGANDPAHRFLIFDEFAYSSCFPELAASIFMITALYSRNADSSHRSLPIVLVDCTAIVFYLVSRYPAADISLIYSPYQYQIDIQIPYHRS